MATSARRVVGWLTRMPRVVGLRVRQLRTPSTAEVLARARASLSDRASAPLLVLVIVALTAVAGFFPLGAASVAGRDPGQPAAHRDGPRSEPAGGSTTDPATTDPATTAADASRTARSSDPAFGADGTFLKPAIPASRAPGIVPVVQRYRTVRGDSLWSISRRFGTDTMSIWWANVERLRKGLRVGQVLAIPPGHGILHTVAEGDTLTSIAATYRSKPQSIVKANGISGETVLIGQLLLIPDGRGPSYPKGLLPERRPALEPASPDASARGGMPGFDRDDGMASDVGRQLPDLLAHGALSYGSLVAGVNGQAASGATTAGVGVPDGPDGGRGSGAGTAPVAGSDAVASGPVPTDDPWGLSAYSPDLLDAWGLSRDGDVGTFAANRRDDANRATRQLETAAALAEAKKLVATRPAPKPQSPPARIPSGRPSEGDPGISDEDQRTIPPFDPELARLAAAQLRSDLARWGGHNVKPTRIGEKLPYSGEDVMGVPRRDQLLAFPVTESEKKAGITWLSWPITNGRITQLYSAYHHGLDITGPSGSLIKTAATGRVVWAGWRDNGGGYQVWVRHDPGVYTAYYHMSKLLVRPGQWVVRGKAVGVIGATGYAHGTHLHFEVWREGVPGAQDRRVNGLRYARPD